MKIYRWLFSNFILILLIITVIYSYMFWGNLTGSQTPGGKAIAYLSSEFVEVEEFVNAIKAKQQARQQLRQTESTGAIAEQTVVTAAQTDTHSHKTAGKERQHTVAEDSEVDSTVEASVKKEKPAVAFKNDIRQLPPVTISYSQNQVRVKQSSAGILEKQTVAIKTVSKPPAEQEALLVEAEPKEQQAASQQKSVLSAKADNTTPAAPPVNALKSPGTSTTVESDTPQPANVSTINRDTFVPTDIEQQLNNVDAHGQVIDAAKQNSDIREAWVVARKSYYQRNYSLSEQSYKQVIENTEDNFDAYGELGNVYFNQGKNEQAASAYYEAATILVHKGQLHRARSLTGVLRHLDKNKAEALQKLMNAASEKENKS